jgi:hypothetical protein
VWISSAWISSARLVAVALSNHGCDGSARQFQTVGAEPLVSTGGAE